MTHLIKGRLQLLLGILEIGLLLFIIVPFISNQLIPRNIENHIKARGIDASALLYSDSEEAVEGNYFLLKSK